MAHHSLPSYVIIVTLNLLVCTHFKNLDLIDVIVLLCIFNAMATVFNVYKTVGRL